MNLLNCLSSRRIRSVLLIDALLACTCVLAAPKVEPNADAARYKQERAVCLSNQSNQDRSTCLREAEAAYAEARRGGLDNSATPHTRNARMRCDPLPAEQREACHARMQGQGSTSGDATSGGIYRELSTPQAEVPVK